MMVFEEDIKSLSVRSYARSLVDQLGEGLGSTYGGAETQQPGLWLDCSDELLNENPDLLLGVELLWSREKR